MPTYVYECKKCGKCFERYQSITAKPRAKCPDCGGGARRKISGGGGIIFKGSGFYETDYKRKKAPSVDAVSDTKETKKKEVPDNKADGGARNKDS